jgi:hypothetical protein
MGIELQRETVAIPLCVRIVVVSIEKKYLIFDGAIKRKNEQNLFTRI